MTTPDLDAKARELVDRATTAYVADGDVLTGIQVQPGIVAAIATALRAARAEAMEECAKVVEDTDVEQTGRGYMRGDDGRETLRSAAAAVRALAAKETK